MENPYEDLGVNELLIAKIYELKSQTDQAISRYQYAADFFGNVPNFFEQANAYVQIAVLYEGTKQWRAALDAYQAALPIAQQATNELQTSTIKGSNTANNTESHSTNTPNAPNNPAPKTGVWGGRSKKYWAGNKFFWLCAVIFALLLESQNIASTYTYSKLRIIYGFIQPSAKIVATNRTI